jgi:phosphoribosylformylglycinamidine cyclo-ligase
MEALRKFNKAARATMRKDNKVFGVAHITGGGFSGNIPRILPEICSAIIDTNSWKPLPVFQTIVSGGNVDFEEAYEVFNMGIGMVLAVSGDIAPDLIKLAGKHGHKATIIGEVVKGDGSVRLER